MATQEARERERETAVEKVLKTVKVLGILGV